MSDAKNYNQTLEWIREIENKPNNEARTTTTMSDAKNYSEALARIEELESKLVAADVLISELREQRARAEDASQENRRLAKQLLEILMRMV